MEQSDSSTTMDNLIIRSYQDGDQAAVSRLYAEGMLAGQLAPNDTGADIENIRGAYFDSDQNHFWIAELDGQVLGMIGVAADLEHTAEIRRLRVDKASQDSPIAERLLETSLSHCKGHSFVKVVFDTRFERDAALDLFDRFGFQHTRTKPVHGKELLEFYLDLYRHPKSDQ